MDKSTVAAGFPKAFLDFAVTRGADRRALVERSRIRPEDLCEPNNRVPLADYLSLLEAGVELCNEPALALLFGEGVRMQDISVVGLMGEIVEDVEAGRRLANRYSRLLVDFDDGGAADSTEFVSENGNVWLKFKSALYREHPLITESAFARCVCGARERLASGRVQMSGPFPKEIHFTHAEPAHRAEYDRIFGVPLVFGSHTNAFLLDEEVLSMLMPRPNPYLSQILIAHAEELLKDLERSRSTRGRVEGVLLPLLHTGGASVAVVADELGVSRQTLFRRLRAEGTTFEQVLDELRRRLALQYLSAGGASVNETAYLLGFSEPAAFSRAFKRWTGSSPRMMRPKG
jgi:AraC-like DNA-binding protein